MGLNDQFVDKTVKGKQELTLTLRPFRMSNVKRQTPFLQIGKPFCLLPLQALIRKYPYGVIPLKARSTTGRVWPEQVSGVCLIAMVLQPGRRRLALREEAVER